MTSARTYGAVLCLAVLSIAAIAACSLTAAAPAGGLIRIALPESDAAVYLDANGTAAFTGTDIQRIGQTGEPSLPCQSVMVLLPPDADLSTVEASITGRRWTEIAGEWDIPPVGPLVTGEGENTCAESRADEAIAGGRDAGVYGSDALFPNASIRKVDVQVMRGWKMAQILYAPLAYNPVGKKVFQLSGSAIEITFERTALESSTGGADLTAADEIREMAANFAEMAGEYGSYAVSGDTGRYVIITTSAIQAASSNLEDFVASKEARGFTVQVVTEATWGGGTGDTAAENIRSWLQANYISLDIRYVLLIGNPNPPTGTVPMKMCYPQDYDTDYLDCPTDFYYAELTSNDWDKDGDGRFGEYDGDFSGNPPRAAEVAVGRIPYYGDVTDLDDILAKIIAYEAEPETDISWHRNVLLPMEPSDPDTPGYQLGEEIKDDILVPNGRTYHRVYDDDYDLDPPPETTSCTVANVTNAWNGSDFGAVFWWTHGSETSASGVMNVTNAAMLDDAHPSFTFQCSCLNGSPETTNNLGYTLLKNGCVATVSASRISWYEVGQTSFAGTPTNSGMTFEYANLLIASEMYAGDALNGLKTDIWPYHEVLWMNYLDFNLYGCPAVGLYTPPLVQTDEPTDLAMTSARLNGELESLGTGNSATVSFEWGTASGGPYPNQTDGQTFTVPGVFFADLSNLDPGTTYYARAKGVGWGTGYGDEKSLATLPEPPTVTTNSADNVTTASATLHGSLEDLGTADNVTVCFEWGTDYDGPYPNTVAVATPMTETGAFSALLNGLAPKTTYYYVAKAIGDDSDQGEQVSFTTLTLPPSVSTDNATDLATTSARLNGSLSSLGTATSVSVSFEWGTAAGGPYPNSTDSQTRSTTGSFYFNLTGLTPGTTYYYMAMADGDGDPVYGTEKSFTTLTIPPSVTTVEATGIGLTSATLNGDLQSLGTASPVQVSFEWGLTDGYGNTTTPQTMADNGTFSANITGLSVGTTYHYRAKAVGDGDPVYGPDMQFTTNPPPSVTTKTATQLTTSYARLNGYLGSLGEADNVTVSFVWGTSSEADPKAYPYETPGQAITTDETIFYFDLSGLIPGTTYCYQARASAGGWPVYGGEVSFATLVAPTVTTNAATNLTAGSAQLHGDLISLGSAAGVTVSFQWGTASGDYIGETTPELKSLTGAYYFDLAGLDSGTTYYCRTKAVGDETVYGTEMTFTTFRPPQVDSVSPSSGRIGESVIVIITGTDFTGATAVSFGTEVSVGGFVLDSATQISATISIGCNVNPGPRGVSVTTPGGTSALTSGFEVVDVTPAPPNNVGPAHETRVITLTPTLSSSAFSHRCLARSHAASQWQVAKVPGDYSNAIFDSGFDTVNLTNIVLPRGVLGEQEWYWWRVRYQDDRGAWSGWSREASFSQPDFIRAWLNGPAEIRVYDSSSRVTGSIDGEVREQIAHSDYYSNTVVVVSPSDSCRFHVVGTQDGSYTLIVTRVVEGEDVAFRADDIPISAGELHEYVIDWEALSHGNDSVTIKIDSDGNGAFDKTVVVEGDISNHEFASATRDHGMPFWLWILVGIGVIAGIAILLALLRADHQKKQAAADAQPAP